MRAISGRWVAFVGVVLWTAAPVRAWPPPPLLLGLTPIGGALALLVNAGVHRELKASDRQVDKLKELSKSMGAKLREETEKIDELPAEERAARARGVAQTLMADLRKGLADILDPDQVKRFFQIHLQSLGPLAFNLDDVQSNLGLSRAQQASIFEIQRDRTREIRELLGQGKHEEATKKFAEFRKNDTGKVLEILDGRQRDRWKELIGEPFEFEQSRGKFEQSRGKFEQSRGKYKDTEGKLKDTEGKNFKDHRKEP